MNDKKLEQAMHAVDMSLRDVDRTGSEEPSTEVDIDAFLGDFLNNEAALIAENQAIDDELDTMADRFGYLKRRKTDVLQMQRLMYDLKTGKDRP